MKAIVNDVLGDLINDYEADQYFKEQQKKREDKAIEIAKKMTIECPNCKHLKDDHECKYFNDSFETLRYHLLSTDDFHIEAHSQGEYNKHPRCHLCRNSHLTKKKYIEHLITDEHKQKVDKYIEFIQYKKRRDEYHKVHRQMSTTLFLEFNNKYKRDPNEDEPSAMNKFLNSLIPEKDFNLSQGYSEEFSHLLI